MLDRNTEEKIMKIKKIEVNIIILPKNEQLEISEGVFSIEKIRERKHLDAKWQDIIDTNFAKNDIYIIYREPIRENVEEIFNYIKLATGATKKQIAGKSRLDNIVFSRHLFHFIFIRKRLGKLRHAGEFTKRHHATVLNSIKKVVEFLNDEKKKDIPTKAAKYFSIDISKDLNPFIQLKNSTGELYKNKLTNAQITISDVNSKDVSYTKNGKQFNKPIDQFFQTYQRL